MTNLEELLVDDTKVSLSHFPNIFKACQKVVKLSLTLNGKSLNEELIEKASLDLLKKGFAKLTHLKMFNFTTEEEAHPFNVCKTKDVEPSYDSWLRILQVLKYKALNNSYCFILLIINILKGGARIAEI